MAKAGRGQTRRDSKRRVLRPGESVRADGKYQYKYHMYSSENAFVKFRIVKAMISDVIDGDNVPIPT